MAEIIRRFGRIESPPDPRDYNLKNFIPRKISFEVITSKKWDFPIDSLDQADTPHCVGFSMADFGINFPTFTLKTNEDGHEYYYKCKVIDGDPDGENGSTIRSAAKVLQDDGVINNYAFAKDKESIKWWLLNKGPLIAGTIWTEEMMKPDENFVLDTSGYIVGGHAYLLNEWREDDFIGIQNSWGNDWGDEGKAYIEADDFMEIFMCGGEALAAVELEDYVPDKKCCLKALWDGILKFIEAILDLFR